MPPTLLIRSDGGPTIGMGHLVRSQALAQAWPGSPASVSFVLGDTPEPIAARLAARGFGVEDLGVAVGGRGDAEATVSLARRGSVAALVLDGYRFDADYQTRLVHAAPRVLVIDDAAALDHYAVDLVLNQNVYATATAYAGKLGGARLLAGPRYALLRREFVRRTAPEVPIAEQATSIFVSMGGSDPLGLTDVVLDRLHEGLAPSTRFTAVVGPASPHRAELEARWRDDAAVRIEVDPPDMADLMATADLAVTAAGSTCLELARLGTPMVAFATDDNQEPVAAGLAGRGAAVDLGRWPGRAAETLVDQVRSLMDDPSARRQLRRQAQALVDGLGAERVVDELRRTA